MQIMPILNYNVFIYSARQSMLCLDLKMGISKGHISSIYPTRKSEERIRRRRNTKKSKERL